MAAAKSNTREILVVLDDGKRRKVSNVPANAKVTYGPVSPGSAHPYRSGNCLRIYTSQNNQLAVFVGVQEFRDLSLTVQEQRIDRKSSEESSSGPKGRRRNSSVEESVDWEDA